MDGQVEAGGSGSGWDPEGHQPEKQLKEEGGKSGDLEARGLLTCCDGGCRLVNTEECPPVLGKRWGLFLGHLGQPEARSQQGWEVRRWRKPE